jgi:DNA repair protein SbcD/Mre11
MKFMHAADIHLDSPLAGLATYGDAPTERLRSAPRAAFTNLVDTCIEESVDFLVVAGDLYDGTWKDYNTGIFFAKEMGRLHTAGIPVFLVHGNHDAQSEMTKRLVLPPNVVVFSASRPQTHRLPRLRVALHGQSFRHAVTEENLAANYPDPEPGWLNVGILHTALAGHPAHAPYAPCSLDELRAKGYDYWALGHVHEYQIVYEKPWVVFPGNLQGRHIRETGPHGAVMVTADETGILSVSRALMDVLRWQRMEVDVTEARNLLDAVREVSLHLEQLLARESDRPVAVRVELTGSTAAHGELFGEELRLRAEISALASSLAHERVWIEKVRVQTSPTLSRSDILARSDAVADLQRILDEAPSNPKLLDELLSELGPLAAKAPPELTDLLPELRTIRTGEIAAIVQAVIPDLIARLLGES